MKPMIYLTAIYFLAYPSNLINQEFEKEISRSFCQEQATITDRQEAREDKNSEVALTPSKPDSSDCLSRSPLTLEHAMEIGLRVWQNECAATLDGLVSWNEKEEFASLGIGHFIWYPSVRGPYVETFPQLLTFMREKGIELPKWLGECKRCPWKNRTQFMRDKGSQKMNYLRGLLKDTLALQAEFLALRLEEALPSLEKHAPQKRLETILANYHRLAKTPCGLYVLVDYVNFKGYGTTPSERYAKAGWGLMQVLDGMRVDLDPFVEFMRSAKAVLRKRVKNSPPHRNEERYLAGWFNRIETYCPKKQEE